MSLSMLRVPKWNVYSLFDTWWKGIDSFGGKCKVGYNVRSLGSDVCRHGGNSRIWIKRPITTIGEGIVGASAKLTINRTDSSKVQQVQQHSDVRQLIADNRDLDSLATFIVFDLETTGFGSRNQRIIEIALQDISGGENSTFHTLVNPERAVPNAHIHGITTNMVNRPGVPRMHELIPLLLKFVRSRQKPGGFVVMAAHNARSFDVPFLINEFKRCSMEIPFDLLFLDTLPLGREAIKSGGTKVGAKTSLQALREHYGIKLEGSAHRAMSDVHSLSLVLQKITYDLKLPIASLVERTFTASELTVSNTKKKKDSN